MKVLVTGVAGFTASRLAARLHDGGAQVVGIDFLADYYGPVIKRRNVARLVDRLIPELVQADLLEDGWQHHLDGVEVVFHQAAQPGVRASWDDGFADYTASVLATQQLEVVRHRWDRSAQARLRRVVYASSSSVYGDALSFPTPEDALLRPCSPYGDSKLAAQHLCGVYARNWCVPTVSLRCLTVYGGGRRVAWQATARLTGS